MIIDTTAQTPLSKNTLRFVDVKPGVKFIRYNLNYGITSIDTFTSRPYFYDDTNSLWVRTEKFSIKILMMV